MFHTLQSVEESSRKKPPWGQVSKINNGLENRPSSVAAGRLAGKLKTDPGAGGTACNHQASNIEFRVLTPLGAFRPRCWRDGLQPSGKQY
jgi:hypothetical protein